MVAYRDYTFHTSQVIFSYKNGDFLIFSDCPFSLSKLKESDYKTFCCQRLLFTSFVEFTLITILQFITFSQLPTSSSPYPLATPSPPCPHLNRHGGSIRMRVVKKDQGISFEFWRRKGTTWFWKKASFLFLSRICSFP